MPASLLSISSTLRLGLKTLFLILITKCITGGIQNLLKACSASRSFDFRFSFPLEGMRVKGYTARAGILA